MAPIINLLAVLSAVAAAPAVAGPAALHGRDDAAASAAAVTGGSMIELADPPMVTEVVPYFTMTETTINKAGEHTLGLGCIGLLGLGCIVEVTKVTKPTVCTITGVGTKTTTYPCSTSTTYTKDKSTFWWTPKHNTCKATSTITHPGTTVIATVTATFSATATVTDTTTTTATKTTITTTTDISTTTASATSCGPSPTTSPLTCDKYGYLIQYAKLIRVDLATGAYTTVASAIGDNSAINAMGYNQLDNYLYGRQNGGNRLLRIASDGSATVVATLPSNIGAILGDIDSNGFYWYATSGAANWVQLDLRPGSPTYAKAIRQGTTASSKRQVADWVHVPVAGRYLWTIGTAAPNGGASLMRWPLDPPHAWQVVRAYPAIKVSGFGAIYGMNNGTIYASDNESGRIWAFNVVNTTAAPYVASQGPPSGSNDGARCVKNLEI